MILCNVTSTGKKIMKNKIALSLALALSMINESKAMDQGNQPLAQQQGDQSQNQPSFIENGTLHFRGKEYSINDTAVNFSSNIFCAEEQLPLLRQFRQLEDLSLFYYDSTDKIIELLPKYIPNTVKTLCLSNQGNSNIEVLLDDFPQGIENISLKNHKITYYGAEALGNYFTKKIKRIRGICLNYNQIDNDIAIKFAHCLETTHLEKLDLSYNRIDSKGAVTLIQLIPNTIRSLALASNPIDDQTVLELSKRILDLPDLEYINLKYCQITDTGAQALARAIAQCDLKIKFLNISHNNITEKGYQEIWQNFRYCRKEHIASDRFSFSDFDPDADAEILCY
jgi:hypothetical protein